MTDEQPFADRAIALRRRLEALDEPKIEASDYGDSKCGCTQDSGPYDVYCEKHDWERFDRDLLKEAREVIDWLLPAWLNRWQPGENQDLIDWASTVRGCIEVQTETT